MPMNEQRTCVFRAAEDVIEQFALLSAEDWGGDIAIERDHDGVSCGTRLEKIASSVDLCIRYLLAPGSSWC